MPSVPFDPAIAVAAMIELVGARRLELPTQSAVQLVAEPLEPAVGDRVLQPGVLAIGPVAEVALDRQHGLGHLRRPVRAGKSRCRRQAAG